MSGPWARCLLPRVGPWLQECVQPREAAGPACGTHLVVQQAGGVSEPLGAGRTAVGPLACVRAQVVGQVEAVLEALAAARTRVGLECSVPGEVAPQVRAIAEALATLTAVKRDARGGGGWCRRRGRDRGRWQRGIIHCGVARVQWWVGAFWSEVEETWRAGEGGHFPISPPPSGSWDSQTHHLPP